VTGYVRALDDLGVVRIERNSSSDRGWLRIYTNGENIANVEREYSNFYLELGRRKRAARGPEPKKAPRPLDFESDYYMVEESDAR
jgi:hypothetical protein